MVRLGRRVNGLGGEGEERGRHTLPTPPSPTQVSLTFASGLATGIWCWRGEGEELIGSFGEPEEDEGARCEG